jgi:hypothetical protein
MLPRGIRLEVRGDGNDERFYAIERADGRVGWMPRPVTELECRTCLGEAKLARAEMEHSLRGRAPSARYDAASTCHKDSAMTQTRPCPKCSAQMVAGFIRDRAAGGANLQSKWVEGMPTPSVWFDERVELEGRAPAPVTTFRCVDCGYLESYAMTTRDRESSGV